jgi:hypothetical protein
MKAKLSIIVPIYNAYVEAKEYALEQKKEYEEEVKKTMEKKKDVDNSKALL